MLLQQQRLEHLVGVAHTEEASGARVDLEPITWLDVVELVLSRLGRQDTTEDGLIRAQCRRNSERNLPQGVGLILTAISQVTQLGQLQDVKLGTVLADEEVLHEGSKAFLEPKIVSPLHCGQIAKPE
uniref:Uncharacterized protein n=1 Tax=Panagrellus redivivus TaxID=6233 RepID=A0A7E4ZQI5_PANRE